MAKVKCKNRWREHEQLNIQYPDKQKKTKKNSIITSNYKYDIDEAWIPTKKWQNYTSYNIVNCLWLPDFADTAAKRKPWRIWRGFLPCAAVPSLGQSANRSVPWGSESLDTQRNESALHKESWTQRGKKSEDSSDYYYFFIYFLSCQVLTSWLWLMDYM